MPDLTARALTLAELHEAPEILALANVWDVASARVVTATPGARALATASHSIAATFGYADGENIPLDLHLDMVTRIVDAVDLPVTMDLEGGYGDAGETAARAIAAGAVGGNLEDQLKPIKEAVAAVEAVLRAGRRAGIAFVLNARTDAFVRAAPGADRGARRCTRPSNAARHSSRPALQWFSSRASSRAKRSRHWCRRSARASSR